MQISVQTRLTKEQKEAIGLLSIGTFLEYFDLMLYVHMAVFLNELFFPKTDPFTTSLLSAFSFCLIFIFRPIGALLFGRLGDHIGRKSIVIITTCMMSLSCVVMAILPTYAQVGIISSWAMVLCRIIQGMSSIGEIIGAEIYLTETIPKQFRSSSVTFLGTFSVLGATAALGMASFVFLFGLEWRFAFGIGALIALIGGVARTTLKETTDFADAKRRIQRNINQYQIKDVEKDDILISERPNIKTTISLFLMDCSWPVCFYVGYIYCGDILHSTFSYTSEQVINHNFFVSLFELLMFIFLTYLGKKSHALKILKIMVIPFLIFVFALPYLFFNLKTPFELMLIQGVIVAYGPVIMIAVPILFSYFPILKRFTYVGTIHALSRTIIYILTSFSLIYLTEYLHYWGIFIVMLIATIGFMFGLFHFQHLEEKRNYY